MRQFPSILMSPTRALLLMAMLGAPLLSGCVEEGIFAHPSQTRGNKVDPELLSQLVVGTSSRADATALIGSPTARGSFDDNTWIYIGETTKPRIGGTLEVEDQHIVVLSFDGGGILRKIEQRGMEDSSKVAVVERKTPSPGNNASILQQLLGNVGRFSPGSAGSSNQNTTGGVGGANKF